MNTTNPAPGGTGQAPSIGSIVHYTLTADDATRINRRRITGPSIAERIKESRWPLGAQAHIGSEVEAGETFPAIVVRAVKEGYIDAQVFLDGNDTLWITGIANTIEPSGSEGARGKWTWMGGA